MGKTPYTEQPKQNNGPSKVKRNNGFTKNKEEQDGGERIQHRRPKNSLKLNEFHQTIKKKNKLSYKKKMRDINRLLHSKASKEGGIDPALQEQKETQLKELKKKRRESRKKRFLIQENEQKYKKIKFFEEQKLKRRLKQVQKKIKELEGGAEEIENDPEHNLESLQKERERVAEDLNYIKYYPLDKKYVALFPTVDDEGAKEKREIMRKQVKEIMARRSVNLQKSIERLTDSLKSERETKMDTFFETEEVQESTPKKKIVDKKGRIITPEFF